MGYMDAWLGEVEAITQKEGNITERKKIENGLTERRAQLQAFKAYSRTMDDINAFANQLPMNEKHIKKLQSLNDRWKGAMKTTAKRYGDLQASMIPLLEFPEKCENWMLFVTQAERGLVADLPTSYDGLTDQARAYDMFIVESGARQQLLRNIVKEGEEMLCEDIVPNPEEFSSKLTNLDKQWSSVLKRARERKTVVDSTMETWRTYKQRNAEVVAETRCFDVEMSKFDGEMTVAGLAPTTLAELMELEAAADNDTCSNMLDAGHRVMALARGDLHARLKKEISSCHGDYMNAHQAVKEKRYI
uniref:Nesprin-1 n=1 Tax=Phallusia mammillata TaxID=59560 RepID=A0A6F9DUQ1_9ASCI|nr:nesprin-1 [Phallusia mammillata]